MNANIALAGDTRMLRRNPVVVLTCCAAIVLVFSPFVLDSPYFTSIAISALMFGLLAAIYDLMIGFAGLSHFGIAGVLAVGAYSSGLLSVHTGISPWAGLVFGMAAGALLGLVTGVLTLRVQGLHLAMMTLFSAEAIRLTIANLPDYTRGVLGLSVPPLPSVLGLSFERGGNSLAYYGVLLALGAGIMLTLVLMLRSRLGLVFGAIREDQLAAQSAGLATGWYRVLNMTIACGMVGLIGAFYAHYVGILSPTPEEFGIQRTVEILTLTYLGGRRSLWGGLAAGALLIGLQEYFRDYGALRLVMCGALLIFVMFFAPAGLAGAWRRLAAKFSDKSRPQ
jgi:branched-chain amino acid transport system permease protein